MLQFRKLRHIALAAAVCALLAPALTPPATAITTSTKARSAILVDLGSDTVLFEKNADARIPPASLSKLMTIEVVLRAISEGRLSLEERFPVSAKAASKGGSKMFVREGDQIRVEDLLRGIIVASGNDSCIVVAEGMDGSESAFADRLNRRAAELGLRDSHFTNSSGWPDPEHYMSARDLATVSAHIIRNYPEFYAMFAEREFTWEGVKQANRNPLLYRDIGADGLKTGHTQESGYGLATSVVRDGRRLVLVVSGLESAKERANDSQRLVSWGFREFRTGSFFTQGEKVAEAEVWMGETARVELVAGATLSGTVPVAGLAEVVASVTYDEPVPAPIRAGQRLGTITVRLVDGTSYSAPVVAASDVEKGGFAVRLMSLIEQFILEGLL